MTQLSLRNFVARNGSKYFRHLHSSCCRCKETLSENTESQNTLKAMSNYMYFMYSYFLSIIAVFIDGTWLYFGLVDKRNMGNISKSDHIGSETDWTQIPRIISENLTYQIQSKVNQIQSVDIVATSVFTSVREENKINLYTKMVSQLKACKFDVHTYKSYGQAEKCVDIALASEMLYLATIPHVYDIAILVGGDIDFMPALLKVRLKGKMIAICSNRNSCSRYVNSCAIDIYIPYIVYCFVCVSSLN